jgi:hypothetical protein
MGSEVREEVAENHQSGNYQVGKHLQKLPGGDWGVWTWVGLRGAGFPVSGVLKLSAPETAAKADRLLEAEREADIAWRAASASLKKEFEQLPSEDRISLNKTIRHLKRGKIPGELKLNAAATAAMNQFRSARQRVDVARYEYLSSFDAAIVNLTGRIDEVIALDTFREATIWQNRRAVHGTLSALFQPGLSESSSRNRQRRRGEELAALYWQRYCTKNDTIGFFGPVGWARLVPEQEAVRVRTSPHLVSQRNVYFDGWCIDALASALGSDQQLRAWIAPRPVAYAWLEKTTLYFPGGNATRLTQEEAALLRACDGHATAEEIADQLIRNSLVTLHSRAKVYEILETLLERQLIDWNLEISWVSEKPFDWRLENRLRRKLERIGDQELRENALKKLNQLEQARAEIAEATGDPAQLDRAFARLEEAFTALTGLASTRGDGKMYAGRTLVYEDCLRGLDLEIGPQILESLGPPLSLILASARWYVHQVAQICRQAFDEIYDELILKTGSPVVDFASLWRQAQPIIFGDKLGRIDSVLPALQEHWSNILVLPSKEKVVTFESAQIKPAVLAAFDTAGGGWQYSRYNSPDIMIAASSVEAIHRGDYQLVLGELHVGTNTLNKMVFAAQHPAPQELYRAFEQDLPGPLLLPLAPKYLINQRTYSVFATPKDFHLEFTRDASDLSRNKGLLIGSLLVERQSGGLVVRTRGGGLQFDIIEVFGAILSERIANGFKIIGPAIHTPRVSIDRLVVSRESWQFRASEMDFAIEKDEAHRFLKARRWAASHKLPRFIYYRTPGEMKPCFVDFESPVYANIFAKGVRRLMEQDAGGSAECFITITEMLPTPEQAWLPDADRQKYTSELRMVTIDLCPALQ